MKFSCGRSYRQWAEDNRIERSENERKWHPYFAALPVRLGRPGMNHGWVLTGECVWLETVEAKRNVYFEWTYRALPLATHVAA